MFAKLYNTEIGQILVKKDSGDNGEEVRIFFRPKGLGVCSIAFSWAQDEEEVQWEKADSTFEKMTEDTAMGLVRSALPKLLG